MAVELLLQSVALVVWWSSPSPDESGLAGRAAAAQVEGQDLVRVLCVGDSFTYGDGASGADASYPMALERMLSERHGLRAQVVNCGRAGQDSREALLSLDEQLRRVDPDYVCVLIGCNDAWNRPALVEDMPAADTPDGFPLRWRTARLIKWGLRDRDPESSLAEHAVVASNAASEAIAPSDVMTAVAERLAREAGITFAAGPSWQAPSEPAAVREEATTAWNALARHDATGALAAVRQGLLEHPENLLLRRLLVKAHMENGDAEGVQRELDGMQACLGEQPSGHARTQFLQALWAAGQGERAYEYGQLLVADEPEIAEAWFTLASITFRWDYGLAASAYERCLATMGPSNSWMAAPALSTLGHCVARDDPVRAISLLHAALLLDGGQGVQVRANYANAGLRPEVVGERLSPAGLDAQGLSVLRQAYDEVHGTGASEWVSVLRSHLLRAETLARSRDARTLFLTYPFSTELEKLQRTVAAETEATLVNIRERMQSELDNRPRDELFVADGHCTDAGYGVMAEEAAAAIARLVADARRD
jgi:hypothetical protein